MRGLLVTPWFAAGAGFVIAAALALNSPHAVLTYRPNTSRCQTCDSPGALATAKPGVVLKPPKPARTGHRAGAALHGAVAAVGAGVGFRVVATRNGTFAAVITVPASQAKQGWILRFELPGRRIFQVLGAKWDPAPGSHGGTASMLAFPPGLGQSPVPVPSGGLAAAPDGDGGHDHGHDGHDGLDGHGRHRHWIPQQLRFLVMAQGSPVTPQSCVLNGDACHFG